MSKPLHVITPLFESKPLSNLTQKKILLKMECFQPTGSFKARGIGRLCQEAFDNGYRNLVASSGGNAGLAVAYAGRKLGANVTVFVPTTTHSIYLKNIVLEGADVRVAGDVWDETHEIAMAFVKEVKGAYIPPFDHPTIWAGHETLVDELITQCEKPEAIVTSVGGGGLLCGILDGLEKYGWSDIKIFSVETEGAASCAASIKAGKLVTLEKINTVATSLGAKRIAAKLFEWTKKRVIHSLVVSDKASVLACRRFVDDHRVLVEPACGAALSTIYEIAQFSELSACKSILVIVCGGVGISIELLNTYMQRFGITERAAYI